MNQNLRKIAAMVVFETMEENGFSQIRLEANLLMHEGLSREDKAFIRYLVSGTLRRKIKLDYIIDAVAHIETKKMRPMVLTILEVAVFELLFMSSPSYAIINEAVEITKNLGFKNLAGFVNGVLRKIDREKETTWVDKTAMDKNKYLSIETSHPLWLIKKWVADYGYEIAKDIAMAGLEIPRVTIAVNRLKINRDALAEKLTGENVQVQLGNNAHSLYIKQTDDMTKLESFQAGFFHVMDESAMEVVFLGNPTENEYVIDVCAAPGGKAFLASYLMDDKGHILAKDIYPQKIEKMKKDQKRLGIGSIEPVIFDGTKRDIVHEEQGDLVFVDAPCSGFGLLSKKPEIKYKRTMKDIKEIIKLQKKLLIAAQLLVKPEKHLIYATCTLNTDENEKMVTWFLMHYPYKLIEEKTVFPVYSEKENIYRDGFYMAKMQKISK